MEMACFTITVAQPENIEKMKNKLASGYSKMVQVSSLTFNINIIFVCILQDLLYILNKYGFWSSFESLLNGDRVKF